MTIRNNSLFISIRFFLILLAVTAFICSDSCAQQSRKADKKFIEKLMNDNPGMFRHILDNPSKYEIQILYTRIDRDSKNRPSFTSFSYNLDNKRYFYPASTVKLPAAIASLQKLNEIGIKEVNKYTPLKIDSAFSGQSKVEKDKSSHNGLPSIGQYIRKVFLVSDNDAFNRMYEFTGQKYINETMWKRGFSSVRLLHRLSAGFTPEENRHTNPFTFYENGKTLYTQPEQVNTSLYKTELPTVHKGIGFYRNDSLINEPKDFSFSNNISIEDLHGILKSVIFPDAVPAGKRFNLKEDDYRFMYKYMSMLPGESRYPDYSDTSVYYDSYCKYFLFGDSQKPIPSNIRIFNKIGMAYGFLIDNAYIVDFDKKIEFLLTAVIYVNEDGIFNDDKYEYETIGFPFLANLGRVIYDYEVKRERKHLPDLSRFVFDYTESN